MSKFLLCIVLLSVGACSAKSRYEKLLEQELAKQERHDELFMGLRFGQTDKQFYEYCRQQNQKGIFMQGAMNGGIAVQCSLDELTYPATMDFYPQFTNDRINEIKGKVKYNAWAPWNKHLYSERLLPDMMQLFEKWYSGNTFIEVDTSGKERRWVKLDGNRRISLKKEDDLYVAVEFTDMQKVNQNGGR